MNANPQQQKVIDHLNGPALVIAVPGSGKTTVVTKRTEQMVAKGVKPDQILCITFTNKAANEMKSRITNAVGYKAKYITISTFHSLCARILRENPEKVGLKKNFTIYDSDDQLRLMKNCIAKVEGVDDSEEEEETQKGKGKKKKGGVSVEYLEAVTSFVEWQRNTCLPVDEMLSRFRITGKQYEVITTYYAQLKALNAIDFTGLLSETNRLFEENPVIRDYYRQRWQYLNVDEVQDTCVAQFRLIIHLAGGHKNVLVVGDNDQALYRFRGASPENIFSFESEFKPVIYKLEKNYRSTPEILDFAHSLIVHNKMRKDADLKTDNPSGEEPFVDCYFSEQEMVEALVSAVRQRIRDGVPLQEIALLYRTNYLSRALEMGLKHARIPCQVIGGLSFWDRKEVKVCVSILKFIANPADAIAFSSAVESCCKGAGAKFVSNVLDAAKEKNVGYLAAAKELCQKKKNLEQTVMPFIAEFEKGSTPDVILENLVRNTGFLYRVSKGSTIENDRKENVNELIRDFRTVITQGGNLSSYLQDVSLISSSDTDSENGKVNLMTVHACKGLEFDTVFLTYAMENITPHKRILELELLDPPEYEAQMEEERRIFYVAMTRAKKCLIIYSCLQRYNAAMELSRFIGEANIPVENHPRRDFRFH